MPARPLKVSASAPEGRAEAGHLDQAPRHERTFGVVPETQAVTDAGRNRDHVFDGAGQFDADDVGIGVHAKAVGIEQRLHPPGQLGDSREAATTLAGMRRAISSAWLGPPRATTSAGTEDVDDDLARPHQRARFPTPLATLTTGTLVRDLRSKSPPSVSRRYFVGMAATSSSAPSPRPARSSCVTSPSRESARRAAVGDSRGRGPARRPARPCGPKSRPFGRRARPTGPSRPSPWLRCREWRSWSASAVRTRFLRARMFGIGERAGTDHGQNPVFRRKCVCLDPG